MRHKSYLRKYRKYTITQNFIGITFLNGNVLYGDKGFSISTKFCQWELSLNESIISEFDPDTIQEIYACQKIYGVIDVLWQTNNK
jgi:hypothetical protein